MRILVPVKRVPDPYGRVRLNANDELDDADIKWVVNPFDEIALEEAVRIREKLSSPVEIVAVTIGPEIWQEQLRTSLAMGADRAIHIVTDKTLDAANVAEALAAVAREEAPDIILLGKQAIDDDAGQTGGRLAASLNWPQACFASNIELVSETRLLVEREVDSGRETIEVPLPAVVTADLRLNEPRYVALPAIIKARSKPINTIPIAGLVQVTPSRLKLVKLETPAARKSGRRVGSVSELVTALKSEGVI